MTWEPDYEATGDPPAWRCCNIPDEDDPLYEHYIRGFWEQHNRHCMYGSQVDIEQKVAEWRATLDDDD